MSEFGDASEYSKVATRIFQNRLSLGRTHVEYWKTIRRGGNGPEGHTIGFSWFATWPTTRRPRFPFGRRPASPLPWTATSSQCRHELAEERSQASRLRYGHEETSKTDHARARWVPGLPYVRASVEAHLAVNRAASIAKNARMGWGKDGSEIMA